MNSIEFLHGHTSNDLRSWWVGPFALVSGAGCGLTLLYCLLLDVLRDLVVCARVIGAGHGGSRQIKRKIGHRIAHVYVDIYMATIGHPRVHSLWIEHLREYFRFIPQKGQKCQFLSRLSWNKQLDCVQMLRLATLGFFFSPFWYQWDWSRNPGK